MRPTWKCCLPGLWVSLRLYEFLMFVYYSLVLCSTHKTSIGVVITPSLFDLSVILCSLLWYFTNNWKSVAFSCHRRPRPGSRSVLLPEVSGSVWSSVHAGYLRQSPSSGTSSLCQHYSQFHRDVEVSSRWHKCTVVVVSSFFTLGKGASCLSLRESWMLGQVAQVLTMHRPHNCPISCLCYYWQSEQ